MNRPSYPPAQSVAATLAEHFRNHSGERAPGVAAIERLINAAFWASLRREEGREPTISLAYVPREAVGTALFVERPLPLTPDTLTRLAPAVERPGIHLGVWPNGGGGGNDLVVWGATRNIPAYTFVVEVIEPGLLVIKHRRPGPGGKFANIAVLQGDAVKIIDAQGTRECDDCPDIVLTLLGFDQEGGNTDNVLLALALSMRAHRHGGSLLVVPHDSNEWRKSILKPVPYTVAPPFAKLGQLAQSGVRDGNFKDAVDAIAGLTAVDGAVVLSDTYDVLAFGAKIVRTDSGALLEEVLVREPVVGSEPVKVDPSELGGTRHLSAAQFVFEQRDSLALVASQDGRFTVFGWSPQAAMVHAYRVEALLL